MGALVLAHEALRPLNLTYEEITQVQNDTLQTPITGPAGANRSHHMAGMAICDAAAKLLTAMKKDDGTYRSFAEMEAEGIERKYLGVYDTTDITEGLNPNTGEGDPTPQYSYMVFLAETETDAETGKTKVLSMKVFYDIGKVGSRQAVDGQAYGSLTHSIGFALSDQYIDNERYNSLIRCGFLYANEIPDDLQAFDCEGPRTMPAPFGSVGCCEGFQSAGHVAVLNAIYMATGVRVYDLPATPEKVKGGMEALARGEEIRPPAPYFLGSSLYDKLDEIEANPV